MWHSHRAHMNVTAKRVAARGMAGVPKEIPYGMDMTIGAYVYGHVVGKRTITNFSGKDNFLELMREVFRSSVFYGTKSGIRY